MVRSSCNVGNSFTVFTLKSILKFKIKNCTRIWSFWCNLSSCNFIEQVVKIFKSILLSSCSKFRMSLSKECFEWLWFDTVLIINVDYFLFFRYIRFIIKLNGCFLGRILTREHSKSKFGNLTIIALSWILMTHCMMLSIDI